MSQNILKDEIIMVGYDPDWTSSFDIEARRIREALIELSPAVEHVGSTAIPGLCAKPIIDILVGVKDVSDRRILNGLEMIGYAFQPDAGERDRLFFRKGRIRTHHLHVVELYGWAFWRHVIFRDYLISHPSLCAQYGKLKLASAERYRFDRTAYTESKSEFIESVLRAATLNAFIVVGEQNSADSLLQSGDAGAGHEGVFPSVIKE